MKALSAPWLRTFLTVLGGLEGVGRFNQIAHLVADFGLFWVLRDCLISTVKKRVGYEASLAHVESDIETVEEMAISLTFRGFSDKLFIFAEIFIDILLECAKEGGFESD